MLKYKERILKYEWAFYFLLFAIFFSSPVVTTFDSAWYHKYSEILNGNSPWSNWDFVRGVGLPIILNITHFLFGYTSQGLLITMFSIFLFSHFVCMKISSNIYQRILIIILFTVNPFILGYFHVFLPEAFGIFYSFLIFYILVFFQNNYYSPILIGLILTLAHQSKESFIIFLLPAFIISVLIKTKNIKKSLMIISISLIVFLIVNKSINSILKKMAPAQTSAASKILTSGLAFGNARTTLFQDRPYRADSIIEDEVKNDQISDYSNINKNKCIENDSYSLNLKIRSEETLVNCVEPINIKQSIKINLFFLKNYPLAYLKSFYFSILEVLLFTKNRYNEISIIGLYMYGESASNVIPIESFDYQKYVEPYSVKSSQPVGYFTKITNYLLSKFLLLLYPFICLSGLFISLYKLVIKKLSILDGFALAGLIYLIFSSLVGMINDRYFLLIYPFLTLIVSREIISFFFWLKRKNYLLRLKD